MDIRKLQRAIVDGLEDVKAQHITVFNTEHLSSMFERVIIASGTSNRQTKALASSVRESVKSRGMQVMATEGEDNGEWIIVDCGAAVAHIMQPAIREYYHLEEIWGGKSVKMKLGDTKVSLVKASEPEGKGKAKATPKARKSSGNAVAGKPPAGKKFAIMPAASKQVPSKQVAGKSAASKSAAGKSAAFKSAASRPVVAKRPAAKTAAPKPAARKTTMARPSVKVAAKPAPARKAPAKKASARPR